MASASDLINGALRLIGQLAEGETPSAETAADGLQALNELLESLNNEVGIVYQVQDETFSWGAGVSSRTIGSGGNFNTTWPVKIEDTTFFRDSSSGQAIDYPVKIIGDEAYRAITMKSFDTSYPGWLFYDRAYPLGTLRPWPVPSMALEVHLATWKPLASLATLAATVTLPPGYYRMLRFNLACELAPEFGVEPTPQVQRVASRTKRVLLQVNARDNLMSLPRELSRSATSPLDIYRGDPQ